MKIGVITTSRADFGIYRPLLEKINSNNNFELLLFVGGSHLDQRFGHTIDLIKSAGFKTIEIEKSFPPDTFNPFNINEVSSRTLLGYAESFNEIKNLDLLFCLGDRYEMLFATLAAIPSNIPIAHIHGGEKSEGAIDNKYRNALSKISDYHFVTCAKHAQRVLQMGAAPDRVFNVGSLGVESLTKIKHLNIETFLKKFGVDLNKPTILFTYHPVTTENESAIKHIDIIEDVLLNCNEQILMTLGNADTYADIYHQRFTKLAKDHPQRIFAFSNLGSEAYASALKFCRFVMGNSSSGVIEAASFNCPVLNIGNRQKGREFSLNVVHSAVEKNELIGAMDRVRNLCGKKFENIYDQGDASQKIIDVLLKMRPKSDYGFNDLDKDQL